MYILEYSVYFTRWPCICVPHCLASRLKITLYALSTALVDSSKLTNFFSEVPTNADEPIVAVEDHSKSVSKPEIAAPRCALVCADSALTFLGKMGDVLDQGEVMFRHGYSYFFHKTEQNSMRTDRTTVYNTPVLAVLLKNAGEAVAFENDEAPIDRFAMRKWSHKHSLTATEDGQTVQLIRGPLSVNVLSVGDVDESRAAELVFVPVRSVEGEVVVDEDAWPVAKTVLKGALVLPVSVVEQVHYIDKNNNDQYKQSASTQLPASISSISSLNSRRHSSFSLSPASLRHSAFSSKAVTIAYMYSFLLTMSISRSLHSPHSSLKRTPKIPLKVS